MSALQPSDPAYWMLFDDFTTTPVVHREDCYICEDPEFAQMGLPLCRTCPECEANGCFKGHIPADDDECDCCGATDHPYATPRPQGFTPDGNEVGRHTSG